MNRLLICSTAICALFMCLLVTHIRAQSPGAVSAADATYNRPVYTDPTAAKLAAMKRRADLKAATATTTKARTQARADSLRAAAELESLALQEHIWVINGDNAQPGQFPYQVAFELNGAPGLSQCSGTLVSDGWVLTAAHCLCINPVPGKYVVFEGSQELTQSDHLYSIQQVKGPNGQMQDEIVCGPNFNPEFWQANDIALARVAGLPSGLPTVKYADSTVEAGIRASIQSGAPQASAATVSGWGFTSVGGPQSTMLRFGPVEAVFNCGQGNVVSTCMLCAGNTMSTDCTGDSGGPLLMQYQGLTYQIGIASWTSQTCSPSQFAVFTMVAAYAANFIEPILHGTPVSNLKSSVKRSPKGS